MSDGKAFAAYGGLIRPTVLRYLNYESAKFSYDRTSLRGL